MLPGCSGALWRGGSAGPFGGVAVSQKKAPVAAMPAP
jgi:hypothetical protein